MSVIHTATCASGARAEKRSDCDCGATATRPYRMRFIDELEPQRMLAGRPYPYAPQRMLELVITGPLTTSDAVSLSIALQEATRAEGERCARVDARRRDKLSPRDRDVAGCADDELP